MATVTKADLAEQLCKELNITKLTAKEMIDILFETIRQTLEKGEELKLPRFGNFTVRDKEGRPGRNPRTGEQKWIKARRVVSFHAADDLKVSIEEAMDKHK